MADVRPFRAWRYRLEPGGAIDRYVSPLFDVVTPAQLEQLYRIPQNSIHLSVPRRGPGMDTPAEIVQGWKAEGAIDLEPIPAVYAYYQHFNMPGEAEPLIRKGLICLVKATPWADGDVLRHESTMPDAVKDRLQTLRETQMQVNPTHGLYHDPLFSLEPALDEAMKAPLFETEDYQGVRDVIAVVQDREVLLKIMQLMREQTIVLADGHHRYEAAVALRREMLGKTKNPTGEEPWQYHLMYLTNDCSPDLRIMATHRLLRGIGYVAPEEWRRRLEVFFEVTDVDDPTTLPERIAGKPGTFGFVLPTQSWKLKLKPGMIENMEWHFPEAVKRLDLTILHYYIGWRILGVEGSQQRKTPLIGYERNFFRCLQQVQGGQADAVVVTNPVAVSSVRQVAELGQTMPPKSTYFYPKVVAGFVMSSLIDEEFYSYVDTGLGLATQATITP
ncbi:DUF1015 domain-containing protein [Nostoc sp. NIES-2111]